MRGVQTIECIYFCSIFTAVTSVRTAFEIIYHIIDIIQIDHVIIALRTVKTARTLVVIHQQVMVVRCRRTTPLTSIPTRTFRMSRVVQTFMYDTILHRDKMTIIGIHILLCRPAELTVINDIIAAILCAKSILSDNITVDVMSSYTKTNIAYNEVLRSTAVNLVMRDNNTYSGCSLTRYRIVLTVNS